MSISHYVVLKRLGEVIEQRLGVSQVSGVEALDEPVLDVREHRVRFLISRVIGCRTPWLGRRAVQQRSRDGRWRLAAERLVHTAHGFGTEKAAAQRARFEL